MSVKNSVKPLEIKSIDSSTMTASYQALNPTGLEESAYFLRIVNDSSQAVTISFDGTTDHDVISDNTTTVLSHDYPAQNNAQPGSWVALWAKGTKVYVKGTAGTGNVYLTGLYVEK